MMRKILMIVLSCWLIGLNPLKSQVTTSCFEIEGILVDACGNDEGNNEMVRFLIGPNPLNTSNMQVTWATVNNPWGGVCQNSSTAQKVAQLNSTIQACGFLKEPTGGILPANSKVLLVSGFDFEPANNSFAGLSDTVYIIFNCASPGTGNFANSGSGIRTFQMSFNNPSNCADQVDYDRSKLIGGNGAAVSYAFDGSASYFNNGCSVPFTPLSAAWSNPGTVCAPLNLSALVTGTPGGTFSGEGVTGNTFDPAGLSGQVDVTYTVGNGSCTIIETKQITVSNIGSADWTAPVSICSSEDPLNLNLLITGDKGGVWSGNGVTDSLFDPAALQGDVNITYTIGSGPCQSSSTKAIAVNASPAALNGVNGQKDYCSENVSPLQVDPEQNAEVRWYADSQLTELLQTGISLTPDSGITRTYYVLQFLNNCPGSAIPVTISFNPIPEIPQSADTIRYCSGTTLPLLQATGSGILTWYTDASLSNEEGQGISFQPVDSSITSYFITNTLGPCESTPRQVNLVKSPLISVSISPEGPIFLCAGDEITLTSSSATGNLWSTTDTTSSISIQNFGLYFLELQGPCNTSYDTLLVNDGSVIAAIQADPSEGDSPLAVTITDQSVNASGITYQLNGNPVNLGQGNSLLITQEGINTITQIVSGPGDCKDTISVEVIVSGKLSVEVPNSFTPNGDGYNEWFSIKSTGIKTLECVIFNRWGSRVKEMKSVADNWDGTFNGNLAPDGVYFYVLKATGSAGQSIEKNGAVTLLR
jgi:gliding motility-associated-like protein